MNKTIAPNPNTLRLLRCNTTQYNAYSAAGLFITKLRSRLIDKSINVL